MDRTSGKHRDRRSGAPGRRARREPPRPRRRRPSSAASGSGTGRSGSPRTGRSPTASAGWMPPTRPGPVSRTWRPSRPPSAAKGSTRAVVLGMGGSSLAPEVFARSFPTAAGGLELEILDTTEPGAVAEAAARLDLGRTLFLVSSKSGSTAELVALLSFFYDRAVRALGESRRRQPVRRHHRPGEPSRGAGRVAPVPPDLPRPVRHRRTVLRPFGLRTPARGPQRHRPRTPALVRERGGRRVPGRDRRRESRRPSRRGPGLGGAPGRWTS